MKGMFEMMVNGFPGDILDGWAGEQGNTFFFDKLTNRGIITLDPDVVKAMLATQFDSFGKGEEFTGQMDSLPGSGIFNADGEMWKFHRAMTRPFFTKERINDFEIYSRNCDISLALAKERLRHGEPIEFQDLVGRFTLDSATEFLFGQSVQSLAAGIPYPPTSSRKMPSSFASHPSNIFVDAFFDGQRAAVEHLSLGFEPLMAQAISTLEQNQKIEDNYSEKEENTNLLAHLVRHTQDPKILLDQLVNLLVAGRDTTADLLSFSMYMITQHPDIERRLREEILEKVGPKNSPTYAKMKDMKYVKAFLNEVLRMYPPVLVPSLPLMSH
ncbi:cytochrome P450 [Crepidotus variabilis]|uniref:Cytochrome P450 n=1 Tax=Crepidotus variabilis TaxID=179855 RepID=A0A9P6ELB9_9AGAR|nr:cytochrome P450 [Crepidotus variabilis]